MLTYRQVPAIDTSAIGCGDVVRIYHAPVDKFVPGIVKQVDEKKVEICFYHYGEGKIKYREITAQQLHDGEQEIFLPANIDDMNTTETVLTRKYYHIGEITQLIGVRCSQCYEYFETAQFYVDYMTFCPFCRAAIEHTEYDEVPTSDSIVLKFSHKIICPPRPNNSIPLEERRYVFNCDYCDGLHYYERMKDVLEEEECNCCGRPVRFIIIGKGGN